MTRTTTVMVKEGLELSRRKPDGRRGRNGEVRRLETSGRRGTRGGETGGFGLAGGGRSAKVATMSSPFSTIQSRAVSSVFGGVPLRR